MTSLSVPEWKAIRERVQFAQATEDTSGSNILSSDVNEDRVNFPLALIISDTSSSANTVDIQKVEEDDTTTDIAPNFNLASDETRVFTLDEIGFLLPRIEGGANLKFTAGSANVEVTMLFINNIDL